MKLTTVTLDYVTDLGEVSGVSVYGVGLFTGLFYCICAILGKSSVFLGRKLERAKEKAVEEMKSYAAELQADGVMNIRYQLSGLSVLVYGTAFCYPAAEEAPADNAFVPEEAPAAEEAFALAEEADAAPEDAADEPAAEPEEAAE